MREQPYVAGGPSFGNPIGADPPAVVRDHQHRTVVQSCELDPNIVRTGMFDDVGQQLSCGAEQDVVRGRAQIVVPARSVDVDHYSAASLRRSREVPDCAGKTHVNKDSGMQLRDGGSQQRCRFTERFPSSRQGDRLRAVCQFVEIHPRREDVLQRPVV